MKTDASMLKTGPSGVTVDLMRGLLALMVLVAHALESGLLMAKGASLPSWMSMTLGHGGFWVNGFFVLSGFCIHRAIMNQRRHAGSFAAPYLLARVTRLCPLYFLALALALLVLGWPGLRTLLSHVFMLQGITGTIPALKPAWSLTYEVAYYAAWPAVLCLCGWRAGRSFLVAGLGTMTIAGLLFIIWKRLLGGVVDSPMLPVALIAAQFPLWLGGAWLAEFWEALLRYARRWMMPAALFWTIAGYLLNAWLLHRQASTSLMTTAGWLVLPGWLGLVLGSACWQSLTTWVSPARWLGLLSYPLYILHQPLLDVMVLGGRTYGLSWGLSGSVALLAAWVMVCMAVIGVPLEARLLAWRSHWLGRQQARSLKALTS